MRLKQKEQCFPLTTCPLTRAGWAETEGTMLSPYNLSAYQSRLGWNRRNNAFPLQLVRLLEQVGAYQQYGDSGLHDFCTETRTNFTCSMAMMPCDWYTSHFFFLFWVKLCVIIECRSNLVSLFCIFRWVIECCSATECSALHSEDDVEASYWLLGDLRNQTVLDYLVRLMPLCWAGSNVPQRKIHQPMVPFWRQRPRASS